MNNADFSFLWILLAGAIVLSVAVVVFVLKFARSGKKSNDGTVLSSTAKLIKTTVKDMYNDVAYMVTFELPDNQKVSFDLSEEDFNELSEGDKGVLTYQDDKFMSFTKES